MTPRALLDGFAITTALLSLAGCGSPPAAQPVSTPTFEGQSDQLKQTRVVATLDAALDPSVNTIWCATLNAAWKELQEASEQPPSLAGAEAMCAALNSARDTRPDLPAGQSFSAAGAADQGILQKIDSGVRRLFPHRPVPSFPGIAPDSLVLYGYLETKLGFTIPYFQNDQPLRFTDGQGHSTPVRSFGIRKQDDYAYRKLRNQVGLLYRGERQEQPLNKQAARVDFAIDLCRDSKPAQLVIARVPPEATLAETLAELDRRITAYAKTDWAGHGFGPNDVLLVPEMAWHIVHRFAELEGKPFSGPAWSGKRIDVCQQEIQFRMDRGGVELESEAKAYALPIPTYFEADGPFLLYMKKRDATQPFFVMWVANAELLSKWGGGAVAATAPASRPAAPTPGH